MCSATCCGGASSCSPSLNPSRIPSVAKRSTSPRARGTTCARTGGSSEPTMPPRATSTRASSVPLPCWLRMCSATCCGGASSCSPSLNPSRIPSVAKMRTSPRARGTTCARTGGSSEPTMPPRVTRLSRDGLAGAGASTWNSMQSTLPTPAHVSVFWCPLANARLITTPREPLSATWQRWSSANTDSDACSANVCTAVRAAVAASAPWPSPSTTATSTPVATALTRCASPDWAWPGSADAATPQSSRAEASTEALGIHAPPFLHRHGGPLARIGDHLEVVHETAGAGKPETQTPGRGVPVLHGAGDVADPGALIARHDDDALTVAVRHDAEGDFAALGVHQDVPSDLGDRGRDHRLVAARESRLGGQVAPPLPRGHHVDIGGNRDQQLVSHGRGVPARGRCGPESGR